jgi:hypothetical protein
MGEMGKDGKDGVIHTLSDLSHLSHLIFLRFAFSFQRFRNRSVRRFECDGEPVPERFR